MIMSESKMLPEDEYKNHVESLGAQILQIMSIHFELCKQTDVPESEVAMIHLNALVNALVSFVFREELDNETVDGLILSTKIVDWLKDYKKGLSS